jgi:hypothetical protein
MEAWATGSLCIPIQVVRLDVSIIKIKQDPDAIYTYDGALSDHKETAGLECDVVIHPPCM